MNVQTVAVLGQLEAFVVFVGEQIGAGYLAWQLIEMKGTVGRPFEDGDVDFVRSCGGTPLPGGDEFWISLFIFLRGAE